MDEEFQWEQRVNGDSIVINQGVDLDGVYSDKFAIAFYDYKINSWIPPKTSNKIVGTLHGTLKVEADFKYCSE